MVNQALVDKDHTEQHTHIITHQLSLEQVGGHLIELLIGWWWTADSMIVIIIVITVIAVIA
jgi:hypothetical protein